MIEIVKLPFIEIIPIHSRTISLSAPFPTTSSMQFYQILSACTDQLDRFKKYLNVI